MKVKIKFLLALSILAGIMLCAFSVLYYVEYVDPTSLLVTPSVMVNVFMVCCSAAIILLPVLQRLIIGKCDVSSGVQNNSIIIFASSLLGFLFAGYIVNFLIIPIKNKVMTADIPYADVSSFGTLLKVVYIIGIVLAIPCVAYFIIVALEKKLERSAGRCLLALAPVLFLGMRLIYTFMSTSAKVNIAGRKIQIVALCLCILFFLAEAGLCAPLKNGEKDTKESLRTSARYLATGYMAITALFVSQVSVTLLQAFWLLSPPDTYILNGIFITMIIYIAARISSVSPERA